MTDTTEATVDPITFEVLRNAFMGIVDEMGLMLERVAHSLVVSEGRDFSTAICDEDGRLVAEGKEDLPAHVGTLPHTVKAVIDWLGKDRLREGDIIIMNDAFLGGTHCQDVRTIMPVYRDGALVAFTQNSAHWSDLGGPIPGSFHAEAVESYGEALYIPPIHLVREGTLDDEVLRFILRNTRVADLNQGDVFAQIAACQTGEARLQAMIDRHGLDVVRAQMVELQRYSETLLREEFAAIEDGTYSFEDAIDFDPMGDRVTPIRVAIDITIDGDRAIYDLSRSDPQARGAVNATRSMSQSALVVATKAIFPHVPASEGMYEAITVVNPEGLVTNAQFPAAVGGAFATSYEVICACVFGAFLQMRPERSMVCGGNMTNMVVGGHDPRPGYERDYVMYLWKEGGYGARPGKKDNHTAISLYASGTRNEPVEVQERVYPILTRRYEMIPDSAGAGRHRGGIGVTRDFQLTHSDATLSVLGSRAVQPVWGYDGGREALGSGLINDAGGDAEEEIGVMRSGVAARRGALIRFWEGGGGGWGDPLTRPVEWVLEDVIDGYVTVAAAREMYGVAVRVVDEQAARYEVDEAATARLRGQG
ncbi:MAG TPA: hydantoinase B/oxoprolinase family protein [Solirubrobacteraceae bacterium]|nr:hydantoinase B/oxoprolinase family protein [Solirubrobacteraceae bacterium]